MAQLQDGFQMLNIIYEDNHLLVVVKPNNILTQGDNTGDVSLLDMAKQYVKERYKKPGAVYMGLVHRLDRPVGGLIVFAKTSKAASRLSEQLRTHAMGREYLAVVCGSDLPASGTLENYVSPNEKGFMQVTSHCSNGAQLAKLHYEILAHNGDTSLVHITLQTGRKHQIRVQFSHYGYPLLYDMRYGNGVKGKNIALWGAILRLTHPITKEPMIFTSSPETEAFEPYQNTISSFLLLNKQ